MICLSEKMTKYIQRMVFGDGGSAKLQAAKAVAMCPAASRFRYDSAHDKR
jgi:hypothetical protein